MRTTSAEHTNNATPPHGRRAMRELSSLSDSINRQLPNEVRLDLFNAMPVAMPVSIRGPPTHPHIKADSACVARFRFSPQIMFRKPTSGSWRAGTLALWLAAQES